MPAALQKRTDSLSISVSRERGIGLLEPLVLTAMVMIVIASTATIFRSINRRVISTQQQVVMQASIDDNIKEIKTIERRYTCCSGSCKDEIPTSFGVASNITQPCATNNPMDDRYYFPQVDLASTMANFANTTTSSEPVAVEQLCAANNNTAFMTPFKNAVDALEQPTYATRNTAIQPEHILRVTFTDNNNKDASNNNKVVRVENIIPHMANYCT